MIKTLWHDARFALRSLRRHPGFACVAACIVALAIGVNTAVFTVVNGVLLRPLPFADADRLMVVSYWPAYTKGNLGAPAEATAKLIDKMPEASVFTMGDNAYFFGNKAEYDNCYKPRWGRFLSRTYPSPGNHEYENGTNGSGYFDFFGGRPTGDGGGYYSYTLGNWHVIALNSEMPSGSGTAQMEWLRNELSTKRPLCTAVCRAPSVSSSGVSGSKRCE